MSGKLCRICSVLDVRNSKPKRTVRERGSGQRHEAFSAHCITKVKLMTNCFTALYWLPDKETELQSLQERLRSYNSQKKENE